MANLCTCFSPPSQQQNESATDFIRKVQDMEDVQDLIGYIDQLISKIRSGAQEHVSTPNSVASSINSGGNLVEMLSKRLKWHVVKKCLLSALDRQTRKVLIDGLNQSQRAPLVGMGLSIIAHLLERAEQVSSNVEERLNFLHDMYNLAKHMRNLDSHLDRAKLNEILFFIVNATVVCSLQMEPNRLCRFISAPLDSADLQKLKSQLMNLYPDLQLEALTEVLNRIPAVPGPSQGEYPHDAVGIEKAETNVIQLLDLQDESRRVVVIYGVGGIGKTTLASAVFQRLDLSAYQYCRVFMDHYCKDSDLPPIQQQILHDGFKENWTLINCTQGREKLSEAFGKASQPVFLFIDNALRQPDLEMLLPVQHLSRLPIRSRILVTTRNFNETQIFPPHIQVYPHRVDPLSTAESKRLLCQYALGDPNSSFDPDLNVDGLLRICGGIPLVLRLIGSELGRCGNTVSGCGEIREYIEEWQRTGLEGGKEDLGERMVDFVYRRLRKPCQEAYLDIAFFFCDWERSRVCDIVGERELRDLEGAALVTTSEEEVRDMYMSMYMDMDMYRKTTVVKMHDIVRARGRKLSEGKRIIDRESLVDLLSDEQKLQETKGIWFPRDDSNELSVEAKHVDSMRKYLRVLSLGQRMRFNGRCERAFEQLRLLHISHQDVLPMDVSNSRGLRRLEVGLISNAELRIDLPESLRRLCCYAPWGTTASLYINGHVNSLRELILSNVTLANFETFISQLKSLESLLLFCGEGFASIPEILGNFSCLKILVLQTCSNLEGLPESFGNLSSLQTLGMLRCSMLERLPEGFGNLSSLQTLRMDGCSMLERLPEGFGNLSSLQTLGMDGCSMLERLPEGFGNLSSLQTLRMAGCSMLERLPEGFGNLSSLQTLDMHGCSKLERLPEGFENLSSLQTLRMAGCCKLERLPEGFGNLSSLQTLKMDGCSMLERLPEGFGNLSSLQTLEMPGCSMLERLPEGFGNLSSLQTLRMNECSKLERLPEKFDQMSCLETLKMDGLKMMCSLSHFKCLKFLSIRNCKDLNRVNDDIVCLTSLTAMRAYGCPELEAKAMDSLIDIKSLLFLEMGESPMLIKRWEEIQQHRPLIGAALRFDRHNYPYAEIMSTLLFSGASRFLNLDGDGEWPEVASSSFPDAGVKVVFLLTACALSDEAREKLAELGSEKFHIIVVDGEVEVEGEGSSWMEERKKRLREMVMQLPEGSRAWISPFRKTNLLFAFLLWRFTGCSATCVMGTSVVVDEEGRKKLSHPLQKIFQEHRWDSRRVDFRNLFSPLQEAWDWMVSE